MEQEQIVEELQKKIKQVSDYKYALDQSSIIAVTNAKGIIRFVNNNFCAISKYTKEELKGQDLRIIIPAENSNQHIKEIWQTIKSGTVWKGEIKHKTKDDTCYWADTTIVPFLESNGQPLQYMIIQTDISERKKTEEKLNTALKRLRQAQEIANVGSWEINFATGECLWSDEACRMYGIPGQNTQSFEAWLAFIHPEDLEKVKKEVEKAHSTFSDSSFRHRIVWKDGTVKHIRSTNKFEFDEEKKPIGMVGVCHDITDRVKAKEELKASEEKFRNVFENSPIGKSITSIGGKLMVNKAFSDMLGYTKEELQEMNWKDITHPDDIQKGEMWAEELLTDLKQIVSGEKKYVHKNGNIVFTEVNIATQCSGEDKPIFFITSIINITERKKLEEVRKKSEANLSAIIENSDALVYSIDKDFRYLTFNSHLEKIMKNLCGLNIKTGDNVFDFLEKTQPEEARWYEDLYKEALKKGKVMQVIKEYKTENSINFSSFSINPIWENGIVTGLSCFVRDITREKEAEKKLIESEKQIRYFASHLNTMQEEERTNLAREIHDELGQQLVGIKFGLSALDQYGNNKDIRRMVKEVDKTIQSLRRIATELRPGILDSLGLIPSIKWLGKEFEKKTGIACKINMLVQEQNFEKCVSTTYFRICQEALTNISKHAGANEVIIKMSYDKNILSLKIRDNGKGIINGNLKNPFSMGLLGMNERARILGGNLEITGEKNKGTCILLTYQII